MTLYFSGIGFVMMSYEKGMRIISIVDENIMSEREAQKLSEYILDEFEELKQLGKVPEKIERFAYMPY